MRLVMQRFPAPQTVTPTQPWPLHSVLATRQIEQAAQVSLAPHTLMQRAGLAVARLALALAPHARTVWIACGPGNNGGDGLEAAVHLRAWGKRVCVTWLGDPARLPPDALAALHRARAADLQWLHEPPDGLTAQDLCVDALLGIGVSHRPPSDQLQDSIRALNASRATVLAVDMPSGLHADTGQYAMQSIAAPAISTRAESTFDSKTEDQLVYIQITRGVAMRDHVMPVGITPTVFAMATPMKPASAAARMQGVACVTADDFRWEKAHIKSTSLLGAVLSRQISADAHATETVMFRGDYLSEAASSNVWVVKDGAVFGPPRDHLVLEGIRYGLIQELCQAASIPFHLEPISRAQVLAADELMLSSATKEVLPVTTLDGQPVGHGKPGPVYQRLYAGYQRAKRDSATSASAA